MTLNFSSNLHQIFKDYLKTHNFQSLKKIAIAVSGGPDSMALAHAVGTSFDGDIYILTVDHQLRTEAVKEASDVGVWVQSLKKENLTHHVLKWDHDDPEAAIMEKARHARYDLMTSFCEEHNIPLLLTGHHRDDQAETFLIRLIKGSGLDGLAGIQAMRPLSDKVNLGRPFLLVSKEELIEYCEANNIQFAQDPSNENADYLRPRLRAFMEGMAEEGLDNEMLARTASRLHRAKDALYYYETQAYQDCLVKDAEESIVFDYWKWQVLPDEIAYRVLQRGLNHFRTKGGYPIRMSKLEDLIKILKNTPDAYTDRTLGGSIIRLKNNVQAEDRKIIIEKEA